MNDSEKINAIADFFRDKIDRLDAIQREIDAIVSSYKSPGREHLHAFTGDLNKDIEDAKCTLAGLGPTAIEHWACWKPAKGKEVRHE